MTTISTSQSFLDSNCDVILNYQGCGSFKETVLLCNAIFIGFFSFSLIAALVYPIYRLYCYYFSPDEKGVWTPTVQRHLIFSGQSIAILIVRIVGLVIARQLSAESQSTTVSITILMFTVLFLVCQAASFDFTDWIVKSIAGVGLDEQEFRTLYLSSRIYHFLVQLLTLLNGLGFAFLGLQDQTSYIIWRSYMFGFVSLVHLIGEPIVLYFYGSSVISRLLRDNLKKKDTKLKSKIMKLKSVISLSIFGINFISAVCGAVVIFGSLNQTSLASLMTAKVTFLIFEWFYLSAAPLNFAMGTTARIIKNLLGHSSRSKRDKRGKDHLEEVVPDIVEEKGVIDATKSLAPDTQQIVFTTVMAGTIKL